MHFSSLPPSIFYLSSPTIVLFSNLPFNRLDIICPVTGDKIVAPFRGPHPRSILNWKRQTNFLTKQRHYRSIHLNLRAGRNAPRCNNFWVSGVQVEDESEEWWLLRVVDNRPESKRIVLLWGNVEKLSVGLTAKKTEETDDFSCFSFSESPPPPPQSSSTVRVVRRGRPLLLLYRITINTQPDQLFINTGKIICKSQINCQITHVSRRPPNFTYQLLRLRPLPPPSHSLSPRLPHLSILLYRILEAREECQRQRHCLGAFVAEDGRWTIEIDWPRENERGFELRNKLIKDRIGWTLNWTTSLSSSTEHNWVARRRRDLIQNRKRWGGELSSIQRSRRFRNSWPFVQITGWIWRRLMCQVIYFRNTIGLPRWLFHRLLLPLNSNFSKTVQAMRLPILFRDLLLFVIVVFLISSKR